jgi:hypothetical protein
MHNFKDTMWKKRRAKTKLNLYQNYLKISFMTQFELNSTNEKEEKKKKKEKINKNSYSQNYAYICRFYVLFSTVLCKHT